MKPRLNANFKLFIFAVLLSVGAATYAESFRDSGPLLYQSEGDLGVSAHLIISEEVVVGEIPATIEYEIRNSSSTVYFFGISGEIPPKASIVHDGDIINRGSFVVSDRVNPAPEPIVTQDQRIGELAPGESFKLVIDVASEVESLDLQGISEVDLVLAYNIPFSRSLEGLDSGELLDTVEIRRYIASLSTR